MDFGEKYFSWIKIKIDKNGNVLNECYRKMIKELNWFSRVCFREYILDEN